jgi:hypothetical protein
MFLLAAIIVGASFVAPVLLLFGQHENHRR